MIQWSQMEMIHVFSFLFSGPLGGLHLEKQDEAKDFSFQ
jgi:hypothetical protein